MANPGKTLAALKVGPSTTELREFDLPEIPPDAALLKVEVAGVCGTDVSQYKLPLRGAPLIMGHENVGYLAKVGRAFERLKGFKEGDLVTRRRKNHFVHDCAVRAIDLPVSARSRIAHHDPVPRATSAAILHAYEEGNGILRVHSVDHR